MSKHHPNPLPPVPYNGYMTEDRHRDQTLLVVVNGGGEIPNKSAGSIILKNLN
jgi:hypothetical protein